MLLEKFRYILGNHSGKMAIRDRFKDIKELLNVEDPFILECGASVGPMIDIYLNLFDNPVVYAFEPQPQFIKILNDKFEDNENITVFPYAVGNETKTLEFNILDRPTSSSLLAPTKMNAKYHGDVGLNKKIKVKEVRLEDYIDKEEVDMMKLDLQGYEMEALKGCGKKLPKIKVITTEVEFVEEYKNQPLFSDIDLFFRNNGFYLYNLYELYTQPDGQLTAGDAIYLNEKYFSKK